MAIDAHQFPNLNAGAGKIGSIEVGEIVAALTIASVVIAPALFGARGGAYVQTGLAVVLLLFRVRARLQGLLLPYLAFFAWLLVCSLWGPGPSSSLFIFLGSGLVAAVAVSSYLSDRYMDPHKVP